MGIQRAEHIIQQMAVAGGNDGRDATLRLKRD